jgi:antitoxin (DNA-binding transcriptional repressor) of toxin-antitoxin stability system
MKSIGVREFRDNATKLLAAGEGLRIERHGHLVGYFVPAQDSEGNPALAELAALLRDAIDESDLTQEEMIALLRRTIQG